MSDTSTQVYLAIADEGLLSKMRFEVYAVLFRIRPATAGEISDALLKSGTPVGGGRAGPGNVSARLVELKELGVAEEIGERECRITQRQVILWDLTGELPSGTVKLKGPVRPPPKIMRAAVVELVELISWAIEKGYTPKDNLVKLGLWLAEKFSPRA